jgi:hypothetical protein
MQDGVDLYAIGFWKEVDRKRKAFQISAPNTFLGDAESVGVLLTR